MLTQEDIKKIIDKIRTINASSSMIMSRYTLDDYEKNPAALRGGTFECNVYKKFDKINRILRNYEKKAVQIEFTGNSYMHINAYPSFELIPLLILENAVKYSYRNGTITVHFDENKWDKKKRLSILISSYGPECPKEELDQVFDKGFRGENAKKQADGSGIGLYFVKILCDLHNIKVSVCSEVSKSTSISGIRYAPFEVRLDFGEVLS